MATFARHSWNIRLGGSVVTEFEGAIVEVLLLVVGGFGADAWRVHGASSALCQLMCLTPIKPAASSARREQGATASRGSGGGSSGASAGSGWSSSVAF